MRKFLSILMVLALVTALFVSCSQDNVGSVVGEDLVSISFATGGSSRTLTVSREVFDENDYIWCYTAVKVDNSGLTTGETKVGELITEAYVWGNDHTKTGLTGAKIEGISQGLWNFTLSAYVPTYDAQGHITGKSDVKAWAGSVTNQPVRKGEANVVNVTVSAVMDPTKTGTITFADVVVRKLSGSDVEIPDIWTGDKDLVLSVKATTLAGAAVSGASVEYKKGEGHTLSNIPEPKFEVAGGSYLVTFKVYDYVDPTFIYAEETIAVNVYSGLKTIIKGSVDELSSYVEFGEPVANAVIEAQTPSVIDVTPSSLPISFVTDSTQSTSYKAASIPAVSVVNIKNTVEAAVPEGKTLTDLTLSLNVADKGSTDAAEKTTKNFEISLDAVVTTTDAAGSVSVESKDITGGIEQFMTVQLYIGKQLAGLKVYHNDVEVKKYGAQALGAEYYEYDATSAGDGILTLHVNHFSPFSVEYSKKVAVARLIKADGTGSDFYTIKEAVDAAANGDTVKLLKDIDLSAQIVVTKELTLDLNGQKLYNTNDLWVGDSWSLISVRAGGDLTITGNGTLDPKENDCYAIDVQDGAKLDVKNGTFFGNITVIYAYDGFVTVEGGTFDLYQLSSEETDKYRFMLNCLDSARAAGDAWFTVTGGTFFNFNPADNQSEGLHTNYVPAGYDVVVEGNLYTVVPYVGEGVVVNMTSVPRTYYTLVEGKLADLDGDFIPEEKLPAKTDKLVLLDSSLANSVDVSIDNFNAGYTWTAIHSETEPDYGKLYFEGGWGTRIEPYLIGSLNQLVNMDSTPESGTAGTELYYALIEDIDAKAHDSEVDWAHGFYYKDPTYYHVNMRNHSLTIGNKYLFGYAVKLEMCNGSIVFDGAASVVDYACYQNVSSYEMYFHDLTLSGTVETSNAHYGLLVSYAFGIDSGSAAFNASNIVNNVSIFNDNSTGYTGGLFGYVQGSAASSSVTDCTFNGSIVSAYAGGFLNPCSFPNGDVSKVTSTGNILNGSLLASTTAIAFGATTTNLQKTVSLGDSASIVVIPESTDLISVDDDNQVILSRKDNVAAYRVAIVFSVHSTEDGKGGYPRYITVDFNQIEDETKATGIYKYEIKQSETDESEEKPVVTDAGSYKIWLDGKTYYVYCPGYEIDKTTLDKTRATIWAYGYDADSKMIAYQKIIYTF